MNRQALIVGQARVILPVYVPARAHGARLHSFLPAGSAIVGTPSASGYAETLLVDFEYSAPTRAATFDDLLMEAATRAAHGHRTLKRDLVEKTEVVQVGNLDTKTRAMSVTDGPALASWIRSAHRYDHGYDHAFDESPIIQQLRLPEGWHVENLISRPKIIHIATALYAHSVTVDLKDRVYRAGLVLEGVAVSTAAYSGAGWSTRLCADAVRWLQEQPAIRQVGLEGQGLIT